MKIHELKKLIREEAKRALNEGPLMIATGASGDLGNSVKELENYLMTQLPSGEDEKKMWDELGSLVADIIHEARMLGGYDDKPY
jgi:hypothetical protein